MRLPTLFSKNPKSLALVFLQFFFLGALWLTGPIVPMVPLPLFLVVSGVGLGVWALWVMQRKSKVQATSDPVEETKLITTGPYRTIRHPMYTSLIILGLGLLLAQYSLFRLGHFLGLVAVLLYKVRHEERLLLDAVPGYDSYRERTSAILPYIY